MINKKPKLIQAQEQMAMMEQQQRMLEVDPDVSDSEELLLQYQSAKAEWEQEVISDRNFINGAQWTKEEEDKLKRKRIQPVVFNVIYSAIEQTIAILSANRPSFMTSARENSDTKTSAIYSDLLAWIWSQSDGNIHLKKVIRDYTSGMGCMVVYHDPMKDNNKGELCIHSIDPLDVYVDPASEDIFCRDAANIIYLKKVTSSAFLQMYPQYQEQLKHAKEDGYEYTQSGSQTGKRGERFERATLSRNLGDEKLYNLITRYKKIKNREHYIITSDGMNSLFNDEKFQEFLQAPAIKVEGADGVRYRSGDISQDIEMFQLSPEQPQKVFHYEIQILSEEEMMMMQQQGQPPPEPQLVEGPEDPNKEGTIPQSTFRVTLVQNIEALQAGYIEHRETLETRIMSILSIGGVLLYKNILPISEYPIICFMNRHDRTPYPGSDVRLVKDVNRYINRMLTLVMAHTNVSVFPKIWVPEGSTKIKDIEENYGKPGVRVFTYNPEFGTPQETPPAQLSQEIYKNIEDAKRHIENVFGVYNLGQGEPYSAPETFKGTVALDEYGQRRLKSKLEDIEGALNQLAKVIVEWVPTVYNHQKVFRIIQPNNLSKQTSMNVPVYDDFGMQIKKMYDVTTGKYDVIVVSGSTLPSNRWARFEYYKELYQLRAIDQIELLKQTEVVDLEGVMERFNYIKQLEGQVQQMTEEIKKLSGDLQTFERESIHANQRVELSKFKADLDTQKSKAKQAVELYSQRLKDAVSAYKKGEMSGNNADMLKDIQREAAGVREEVNNAEENILPNNIFGL